MDQYNTINQWKRGNDLFALVSSQQLSMWLQSLVSEDGVRRMAGGYVVRDTGRAIGGSGSAEHRAAW